MGLGSALASNFMEMTGNITKAVIEIVDARSLSINQMNSPVKVSGGSQSLSGFLNGAPTGVKSISNSMASSAASIKEAVPAKIKEGTATVGDFRSLLDAKKVTSVGGLLDAPGMGSALTGMSGVTTKSFYVQFNPNELSITGYGGGLAAKNNYTATDNKELTFEKMDVRIMLTVNLIFDQVDPQDAFMGDKFNTSSTAMIEGAVKAVRTAAGSKQLPSVQKQVEALIAALRSPYTRQLTFSWGKMSYTGVLNQVAAQYTMFNVIGAPVRANVRLSMVCADSGIDANNMGAWYKAYQDAFGAGSQSFVKNAQKVGNLFNFNL